MSTARREGMIGSRWSGRAVDIVAAAVLFYLFLPIFIVVLYSFNEPVGKFNFVWKAFSLRAWSEPHSDSSVRAPLPGQSVFRMRRRVGGDRNGGNHPARPAHAGARSSADCCAGGGCARYSRSSPLE